MFSYVSIFHDLRVNCSSNDSHLQCLRTTVLQQTHRQGQESFTAQEVTDKQHKLPDPSAKNNHDRSRQSQRHLHIEAEEDSVLRHVDRLFSVIFHGSTDKVECKDDDLLMHIGNAEAKYVHEHVHLEHLTRAGM